MSIESGSPLSSKNVEALQRNAHDAHQQQGTGNTVIDVVTLAGELGTAAGTFAKGVFTPRKGGTPLNQNRGRIER